MTNIDARRRLEIIDVMRGFALWGVIQANWVLISDERLEQLSEFLVKDSFLPLFGFLFGVGFALQIERSTLPRRLLFERYMRRVFVLYAMGALHFVFFWRFDILRLYALAAPVLIFASALRSRYIVSIVAIVLLFSAVETKDGGMPSSSYQQQLALEEARTIRNAADHDRAPYLEGVQASPYILWRELVSSIMNPLRWIQWNAVIIVVFLLGLVVGRTTVFDHPERLQRVVLGIGFAGALIGIPVGIINTWPPETGGWNPLAEFISVGILRNTVAQLGIATVYTCSLILLWHSLPVARFVLKPLGWVGRMSLTNYLVQSAIFTTLLYERGLDLPISAGAQFSLVQGVFLSQIAFSAWWLQRYSMGPGEYVWRACTVLDWPKIRRSPANGPLRVQSIG